MDGTSAEYRNEALKLILFAERTEWAARHGKLNAQDKSFVQDQSEKTADNSNHNPDPNFGEPKASRTLTTTKSPKPSPPKKRIIKPDSAPNYVKISELPDEDKPSRLPTSSGNAHNDELSLRRHKSERRQERQHKSEPGVLTDSGYRTLGSFEDPVEASSMQGDVQQNTACPDWQSLPAITGRDDWENKKIDLITRVQNNTTLVKTLLGDGNTYPLPDSNLMQHSSFTPPQPPSDVNLSSTWALSNASNPGSVCYNYSSNLMNAVSNGHLVPLQPNGVCIQDFQVGSNGAWQWQGSSQKPAIIPGSNLYPGQTKNVSRAPVPVVRDQTLPDPRHNIRRSVTRQGSKPSNHRIASKTDLPKHEKLGNRRSGKVKKKGPKSLKRMSSIAQKHDL